MIRSNASGAPGIIPIFTSEGQQQNYKQWIGQAVTIANGTWTVDYSSAGFTEPPIVTPQPISTANTAAAVVLPSITAATSTGVSGACFLANAVSVLGVLPLKAVGAGIVVKLIVTGK